MYAYKISKGKKMRTIGNVNELKIKYRIKTNTFLVTLKSKNIKICNSFKTAVFILIT